MKKLNYCVDLSSEKGIEKVKRLNSLPSDVKFVSMLNFNYVDKLPEICYNGFIKQCKSVKADGTDLLSECGCCRD